MEELDLERDLDTEEEARMEAEANEMGTVAEGDEDGDS